MVGHSAQAYPVMIADMGDEHHVTPLAMRRRPMLSGREPTLSYAHQAVQMVAGQGRAKLGNILKPHGFLAAKNIAASLAVPFPLGVCGSFCAAVRSCARHLGILGRHLALLGNRPNPLAVRRMPEPQIRRNLTPCQATGERNANLIPPELVAMYRCHVRSL